jgi:predicted DNA-binding protein (MmcQ/YjbR family)
MNLDQFREYCLHFKGATEELPFDENTLVFIVMGKMFSLCNMLEFEFCNLKCDPEKSLELREYYPEVTPAWHMSKKHWNSVNFNGELNDNQIREWISDSYNLVVEKMSKKLKEKLSTL